MLIKINENTCINPEYIINLYLKEDKKKFHIIGRMIDGALLQIQSFDNEEDARREYSNFIFRANIHTTFTTLKDPS